MNVAFVAAIVFVAEATASVAAVQHVPVAAFHSVFDYVSALTSVAAGVRIVAVAAE